MTGLVKQHRQGTHRLVAPEDTLARITPHLGALGITRCADVTGLDCIGVPVYCAIVPRSRIIQTTAGKGLRAVDAKVSALMEALELVHAENPAGPLRRASLEQLRAEGLTAVDARDLPHYQPGRHFDERFILDWMPGEELLGGTSVWLPASAVHPLEPTPFAWSTNGLASGNHLVEATLHALYELLERDALDRLYRAQAERRPWPLHFVSPETLDGDLADLRDRLASTGMKLVLAWTESAVPVHTFWALTLDKNPLSFTTLVNAGYGTHLSPTVAALRAVTEALQARLTMIHASREDLIHKRAYETPAAAQQAYDHFADVLPTRSFWELDDRSSDTLDADLQRLLGWLRDAGASAVYRADLTRPPYDIPVARLMVPGLGFDSRWV